MNALVLGGTGPTGPYIVEGLLQRNYEVTIIHSGRHEVEFSQPIEHIHADVHFQETLKESLGARFFDLVIATYGRLRVTADVMTDRTERFISVGAAVPGPTQDGPAGPNLLISEDAPLLNDVENPFFQKIYAAEQAVLEHHRAGHYIATHLRYPILYGPRQLRDRDWCIVRRILDGRKRLIVADGGLRLASRAYGENAAHAVLLAVDQPEASAGQVYNVSDERVFTLRHRIDVIARMLHHEWELISLPYELARPARMLNPYSYWEGHYVLDITKIKTQLGYRDIVPSEEAIRMGARWLVDNRPEPGGGLETLLNDPFDYAAEDAIIETYSRAREEVLGVPFEDFVPVHPYRHPKRTNEPWQQPERPFGRKRP